MLSRLANWLSGSGYVEVATEPIIPAGTCIFWKDTTSGKTFLVFSPDGILGHQLKVELC